MRPGRIRPVLLVLIAVVAPNPEAAASDRWTLDASAAVATEYVDRGVSQSNGDGVVQGELVLSHRGGFHAGLWGSTVEFPGETDQADAELNFLIGFDGAFDRAAYGARLAHIRYAGAKGALDDSFFELSADLEVDTGPLRVLAGSIYAPDAYGHPGDALYVMVGAARPLACNFQLHAHVGRQAFARGDLGPDYTDWRVGLEWRRGRFRAELAYSDTDAGAACPELCDERLTLILELSR
jgi:uncharacterized protein (TIGR02001 family)